MATRALLKNEVPTVNFSFDQKGLLINGLGLGAPTLSKRIAEHRQHDD
jgi:hypothetical protein